MVVGPVPGTGTSTGPFVVAVVGPVVPASIAGRRVAAAFALAFAVVVSHPEIISSISLSNFKNNHS